MRTTTRDFLITGIFLAFCFTSIILTPEKARDAWQHIETATIPSKVGHAFIVFQGKLFSIGGFDGQNTINPIYCSTNGKDFTKSMQDPPFKSRCIASAVVFKDRLWVIGGININPKFETVPMTDVWSSADGVRWVLETRNFSQTPLCGQTCFTLAGNIWIAGGLTRKAPVLSSSDGKKWDVVTTNAPFGSRGLLSSVSFKGKVFLLGGMSMSKSGNFYGRNDVWSSTNGREWLLVKKSIPGFISGSQSLISRDGHLYLLGGITHRNVIRFSEDGKHWKKFRIFDSFGQRLASTMVLYKGRIIVSGGFDGHLLRDDLWISPTAMVGLP